MSVLMFATKMKLPACAFRLAVGWEAEAGVKIR